MNINEKDLEKYETTIKSKTKYKLMQGVLRKTPLQNVSANQNALTKLPFKFNHALNEIVAVTNQFASGRCWIFAGLNVIRHKLIEKYKLEPNFQLSQAYIAKWDKLEKCNTAIELIYEFAKKDKHNDSLEYASLIQNTISDGGTWNMFVDIVKKYGVMPLEIYPNNFQSHHTHHMNQMLNITVLKTSSIIHKHMDLEEFTKYKKTILDECYRIITICMGETPKQFKWSFKDTIPEKEYTPLEFYDKICKPIVDLNDFVSICHFPVEQYNQILAVEYMHNVLGSHDDLKTAKTNTYLNLKLETFKESIFKHIKKHYATWFACDVSHYWINNGAILDQNASNIKDMFDVNFILNKKESLETRTCVPNHAMNIIACHKTKNGFKRWKVENSHGDYVGHMGFVTMSDKWFDQFVICAAVHKSCLPPNLRNIKKPIKWLPFYSVLGTFAA